MEDTPQKNVMLVVEFKVKSEFREKFLTLMHSHARRTLSREAACLQFDVLVPGPEQPDTVYLVEGYTSQEDLDWHMENSGINVVREIYADWIHSRHIAFCTVMH